MNDKQEFKGYPKIYQKQPLHIDPDGLIDFIIQETFTTRNGKEYKKSGRVIEIKGEDTYDVELPNEKQSVYDYADMVAMANREYEYGEKRWTSEEIK